MSFTINNFRRYRINSSIMIPKSSSPWSRDWQIPARINLSSSFHLENLIGYKFVFQIEWDARIRLQDNLKKFIVKITKFLNGFLQANIHSFKYWSQCIICKNLLMLISNWNNDELKHGWGKEISLAISCFFYVSVSPWKFDIMISAPLWFTYSVAYDEHPIPGTYLIWHATICFIVHRKDHVYLPPIEWKQRKICLSIFAFVFLFWWDDRLAGWLAGW